MTALYHSLGKEVLRSGEHFADACDPGAAQLIADALNRRTVIDWVEVGDAVIVPMDREPEIVTLDVTSYPTVVKGTVCHAYRVNDQMMCACGLQWDVKDCSPPVCGRV